MSAKPTLAPEPSPLDQLRMRIHNGLKAKGLSIRAAEDACDVSRSTFQSFIGGDVEKLSHENVLKLCELLGVSPNELLLGERPSPAAGTGANSVTPTGSGARRMVPHNLITASPLNPRKRGFDPESLAELAESLIANGVLQNLVLRPVDGERGFETGPYEIVAGERRWRAMGLNIANPATGIGESVGMPAEIRVLDDDAALELMLIENIERRDLTPLEEGRAFKELWDRRARALGKRKAGEVVKRMAERFHKSERWVQLRLRLARDLVPAAQDALDAGQITLAHAQVLATAPKAVQTAQTALLVQLPAETQPTAEQLGHTIAADLPDLSLAVFKRSDYDADVFEFKGRDYATDIAFFARLQDKAILAARAAYKKALVDGEIEFLDEGQSFKQSNYGNANEDGSYGVFVEVQDKGAWRVARFIEGLTRVQTDLVAKVSKIVDDALSDEEGDDDGDKNVDHGKPVRLRETPQDHTARMAAAEAQIAPVRAALQNNIHVMRAIVLYNVATSSWFARPSYQTANVRFVTDARDDKVATEFILKQLKHEVEPDEAADIAGPRLLTALLRAPEGLIERCLAFVMARDIELFGVIEWNPVERTILAAIGLPVEEREAA